MSEQTGIVNPKGMTLGEAFTKSPGYQDFVQGFKGSNGAILNVPIQKAATAVQTRSHESAEVIASDRQPSIA